MSDMQVRRETASQTAGPYVHIGLAPHAAGFDIFEKNFGSVLANDKTKGERIRLEGRVFDGIGTDPSFRAPMAIVVIGGLITSTFLSLLVIPVVFTFVDDGVQKIKGVFARVLHHHPHAPAGGGGTLPGPAERH